MSKRDDKGKGKAQAQDVLKNWGYMRFPAIQSHYNELTKDSLEHAVDALWNNILPQYFRLEYNFSIEAQANPDRKSKKRADFAVRFVHNSIPRKVVLVENKRVSEEASSAAWAEAADQLLGYMLQARAENRGAKKTMYGIVTVGRYSRYYTLAPNAGVLTNFTSGSVDYKGQPLHFKHDEYWMHIILEELVRLTC